MLTVSVDFDGVLHAYSRGWSDGTIYDGPAPGALDALRVLMDQYAVTIHTTRPAREVITWLGRYGVLGVVDRHETFWDERGVVMVTSRKVPAIAYVDDRAVHHAGDWDATLAAVRALDPMRSTP